MDFDEYIFDAIRGATKERPQDLVGILYHCDGRMKLIVSLKELSDGLQRLIGAGRIGEFERHRFYEVPEGIVSGVFSGLTDEEYGQACENYHKWFWKTYKELKTKT